MFELIRLSEHDYYLNCPTKIGLIKTDDDGAVVAIDSGGDKDAGKKILRIIEEQGWHLTAIYNTHSHADHTGGNHYLQEHTGCRVFANGVESAFVDFPILEPISLYAGFPFRELRHKFLLAEESKGELITENNLPADWTLLRLPGHSMDMVGFLTADGTAFIGDCVLAAETIDKYGVGYLWDVEGSLQTLEQVPQIPAARFVPAHADVTDDIAPLARRNAAAIRQTADCIERICQTPSGFETVMQRLFTEYGMTMNARQYYLIGSTVRSYFSFLRGQGRIEFFFEDNRMLWKTRRKE